MLAPIASLQTVRALTEEETGPSCGDVPFAVKLTPLGAFSLTSRAAAQKSAAALQIQFVFLTCGSVVEVLVDKLEDASQQLVSSLRICGSAEQNPHHWKLSQCRRTLEEEPE